MIENEKRDHEAALERKEMQHNIENEQRDRMIENEKRDHEAALEKKEMQHNIENEIVK